MALQYVTLKAAADAFKVHPRTIVRAVQEDHNAYWSEDSNEDRYKISDIAVAYGMSPAELVRVVENRDALLKPDEAAEVLGIKPRTFREKLSDPFARPYKEYGRVEYGRIVRYLKSKIIQARIAQSEDSE